MVSKLAIPVIYMPKLHGGKRKSKVRSIVIHHAAAPGWSGGKLAQYIQSQSATRYMNSNYAIGNDGVVVCILPENYRPWTTGTYGTRDDADDYSITIEVANATGHPDWTISQAAMDALIDLVADIAKRYGWAEVTYTGDNRGHLLMHKWYSATSCPGPYLSSKFSYIRDAANKINHETQEKPIPDGKTYYRVQVGAYRNKEEAEKQDQKAKAAGFDTWVPYSDGWYRVQIGSFNTRQDADALAAEAERKGFSTYVPKYIAPIQKTVDQLAREVIEGKWGNDPYRRINLEAAGYSYTDVQARVNAILAGR